MALEPGLGEVDVALDAAQDLVIDDILVAQLDDGDAFDSQSLERESLEFGGEESEGSSGTLGLGALELANVVLVFDTQSLEGLGFRGTPAFIVGKFRVPGVLTMAIADARKAKAGN